MSDNVLEELLFFDTFAHDNTEELNLDLVQFPKPVYVTEVRIIPLGARVQADFPGGVRLGATNPSQFHIELFVNDLGKPGASTFETLGAFEYDQNGKINLQWAYEDAIRKIPTDGLVLKGLYTTITLAVYGILTNNLPEQIVQPIANPVLPVNQANTIADAQQIIAAVDPEWSQDDVSQQPIEYQTPTFQSYGTEAFQQEFPEYYSEPPKDPRSYHHTPEHDWDKTNSRSDREKSSRDVFTERDHNSDRRDRRYSRSESRDRDRQSKDYHDSSRDRDRDLYDRDHERGDYRDRERGRERRHEDSYRRFREDREDRKRPRTPQSPKRPHSPPHSEQIKDSPVAASPEVALEEKTVEADVKTQQSPVAVDEPTTVQMDVEEFEPILSDEDIVDDSEHYQEEYDYTAYTNNDDIIRQFIPGVSELQKYPCNKKYCAKDNCVEVEESLKTVVGIADDYLKSSITKYALEGFSQLNTEIKEEFVHLSEKLIGIIGDSDTFKDIMSLHNALHSKITSENQELANQAEFVIETITDWLKIALDYAMANSQDQPAYKIRHIKCGVRLAEYLSHSNEYLQWLWQKGYKLHQVLVMLYQCEFMALSIKLMLLKALDTYLLHKFSIERFLSNNSLTPNGFSDNNSHITERNGYKIIIEAIKKNSLVREKFALSSILKKLNLYEILYKMHSSLIKLRNPAHDVSAQEINLITKSLSQILNYCSSGPFCMSQPKRFLPVAAQFDIMRSDTKNVLVDYFKMFNLLQCFVLLLTSPDTLNLPLIKTPIFEIVSSLLDSREGLQYLSENSETLNVLLKCLLRTDEEMQYSLNDAIEVHSHNLGLKIAYKLQGLYHIECLLDICPKNSWDFDNFDIIDQLHGMFCLTFSSVGKFAIGELLGMGDNVRCLLQFLDQINFKSEITLAKFKQSSSAGYILDLLYYPIVSVANVRFLEKYAAKLRDCIGLLYEASTASKVNEIKTYLSPFDNVATLNYDNISQFLDVIDRHTPTVISHPGSLITCLRIIQHLGISTYDNKIPVILENPLYNYMELKYKHVILQMYSLDGVNVLIKLLQKLCNHFEQPGLHSSIFVSNQGLILVNIIHPVLLLFNKMMAHVVQCRNTKFKDLTSVQVLLKTYNLLNSFPNGISSRKCKIAIIDCLLVYTQPMSDEDTLSKTLWSQMLGEVIKFITTAPYTFVSGLLVLSELLPLPLPIHTGDDLTKEEITWTINLRKLWSAHLHPHSAILQDTVHKICISTQPQLLNLLRRICVQISDLAANSALMVARGFLDLTCKALVQNLPCTSHIARLLNFLACLVTHNTIKCAVLHLIHCDDKYSKLIPAFAQILRLSESSNSHIQAQECILSIIQSFCDVEVSLLQKSESLTSEIYLANALPVKEHLLSFIGVILDHLAMENSFVTYLPIVRTLLLLTEHDYGFFHLRENLLKRENLFCVMLDKFVKRFSKTSPECLSTLNILVEFLRICLTTEESDGVLLYTSRTITLSVEEMKNLIGWSQVGEGDKHPFVLLEEILKKEIENDNSLETILEGLALFLKQLDQPATAKTAQEVILPAPQPLLAQYSCRIISSSSDACDERLTDRYWLLLPSEEGEGELETVPCDLFEICRQLPPEFNLIKEVEKLCRISRTDPPHVDKAIKHCDDQRIKTRKPFITPMRPRGFPRSTPQRPDLFRSRPPNTSRPPSLHVDDFVALETCGAQPTGPTGYNKLSREILASGRMARGARGRAFVTSERSMQYNRQMPWWGAPMGRGPYF